MSKTPNDSEELARLLVGLDRLMYFSAISTKVCVTGTIACLLAWLVTDFAGLWGAMTIACALAALASDWVEAVALRRWEQLCPCPTCERKREIRNFLGDDWND